jgi:hypothetical protein
VKPELIPLMRIPDLLPFRARALFKHGYKTVQELAGATEQEVAEVLCDCLPFHMKRQQQQNTKSTRESCHPILKIA